MRQSRFHGDERRRHSGALCAGVLRDEALARRAAGAHEAVSHRLKPEVSVELEFSRKLPWGDQETNESDSYAWSSATK